MMVSRVPDRIERRRAGILAIIDSIIQDHRDRRAAGGVDEDEDLLDVLLSYRRIWAPRTLSPPPTSNPSLP
jgi:hypothetical protein